MTGELKASKTNRYPLMLDAPLSSHWLAFTLWCASNASASFADFL